MNEFEQKISSISKRLDYPSTPNISASVMKKIRQPRFISRRLTWSLTLILILLVSLFAIPPVRAAILEFLQIGIVRIFPQQIEPTQEPISTITPAPSMIPLLDSIFGETTLDEAKQQVNYPILLPQNFGEPDYVFVQDAEGYMTILVWMNPIQPQSVELSLHFIPNESWAIKKMGPRVLQETMVNEYKAVWAVGPYPLILYNRYEIEFTRLIEGNVLIWTDGTITYRLETHLSMEEAILIAENLQPIP
ncbi:MAG: hypothetical protein JNK81_08500 [Anaerolineales bacterium]|nr:hypothetical protein [Anaerolineales bacterium]